MNGYHFLSLSSLFSIPSISVFISLSLHVCLSLLVVYKPMMTEGGHVDSNVLSKGYDELCSLYVPSMSFVVNHLKVMLHFIRYDPSLREAAGEGQQTERKSVNC